MTIPISKSEGRLEFDWVQTFGVVGGKPLPRTRRCKVDLIQIEETRAHARFSEWSEIILKNDLGVMITDIPLAELRRRIISIQNSDQ